jgi:N-acyl-L-homoserine lactone synthetase
MRVLLPYHALPSTVILAVRRQAAVVATLSLILDSSVGLPIDGLYPEALRSLRTAGRRVAECSNFAIDRRERDRAIAMRLMRAAFQVCFAEGHNELVAVVNPKHDSFYRNVWGMERIGPERSYGEVRGAAAVGLRLNLEAFPEVLRFFSAGSSNGRNLFLFMFDGSCRPS